MEQQRQTEPVEPRFDRSQAEEALLIAARLQQEHRDQYSLSELKKTAAEVDISPEFVEQALRQMNARPTQVQAPVVAPAQANDAVQITTQIRVVALGIVISVAQFLLVGFATSDTRDIPSAWVLGLMLAGFLAWKLPRGSAGTGRGATYLGVGYALILALMMTFSVSNPYEHANSWLVKLLVMMVLQGSLYFAVRWWIGINARLAAAASADHPTGTRGV